MNQYHLLTGHDFTINSIDSNKNDLMYDVFNQIYYGALSSEALKFTQMFLEKGCIIDSKLIYDVLRTNVSLENILPQRVCQFLIRIWGRFFLTLVIPHVAYN